MALLKRSSPWPAQPTRLSSESSNATEDPFIVLPLSPVSPHRISSAKGQNKVNEARCHAEISSTERVDGTRDRRSRQALSGQRTRRRRSATNLRRLEAAPLKA